MKIGRIFDIIYKKKFYKGFSYNMMTLSEKGIYQIHETAKDKRLSDAELIIALHEWLADAVSYEFLPDDADINV